LDESNVIARVGRGSDPIDRAGARGGFRGRLQGIDLATKHSHFAGCVDADSNLVAANPQQGDFDVIADHDLFVNFSCKNQHGFSFALVICLFLVSPLSQMLPGGVIKDIAQTVPKCRPIAVNQAQVLMQGGFALLIRISAAAPRPYC
jgi:hypothetical protein